MRRFFASLLAAGCFLGLFLLSLWPARWFSRAPAVPSKRQCDYTGRPPFADAAWAGKENDSSRCPLCEWCAGTGHPHGDERYGVCACPDLKTRRANERAAAQS